MAGLPTWVWGQLGPPSPAVVTLVCFYFFQPVHTVTLSASGFTLLIRPEVNSKSSSRQL